jgi:hypothetical protein
MNTTDDETSVKWVAATLDHAEAWVRHLNSTKDIPNTLTQMLSEWKKNKDLTRCIGTPTTRSRNATPF